MFPKDIIIRNIQSDDLFEAFFVSAVSSVFIIRFFLFITRYPQLGGGSFHIAHMLWGGFFMLSAIIIMMSLISRYAVIVAAVLGGIGFGAFIDELGKFITRDNNYFFQPAVAIIYVIFVLVYLLFRAIPKYKAYTQKEYLINAIDMMKEAVINDLDIEEERIAKQYLKHADQSDPIVQSLLQLMDKIDATEPKHIGFGIRLRKYIRTIKNKLQASHFLIYLVILLLVLQSVIAISVTVYIFANDLDIPFSDWGLLICTIVSAYFIFHGMFYFRRSRFQVYKHFKTAVLISLFLTQFFLFYREQLHALTILFINLGILFIINNVISLEQSKAGHLENIPAEKN